jgi:hypothetical protein
LRVVCIYNALDQPARFSLRVQQDVCFARFARSFRGYGARQERHLASPSTRPLPLRDRHRILPWSGPSTESAIGAKLRGHKSSYKIPSGCAARHMRGGDALMQRLRHAARRAAKHKTCRVEGRQALPHGTYSTTARQGQHTHFATGSLIPARCCRAFRLTEGRAMLRTAGFETSPQTCFRTTRPFASCCRLVPPRRKKLALRFSHSKMYFKRRPR